MDEICRLRGQIDEITSQMLELFKKREDAAREIGAIKEESGKNVLDGEREDQLRSRIQKSCQEIGLDAAAGQRLLDFLLSESVKVQYDKSSRITHMSIFKKAKEMEKNGMDIIHMEVGEPDFAHPPQAADLLSEACQKNRTKYGMAEGMPDFRAKIAEYASCEYGRKILSEEVIVTPGARFAVYLAIKTLLERGNEAIVIEPAWPAYSQCILDSGARARIIHTTSENGWEPSVEDIRSRIGANTKMIVLNYPNNPTGKILSKSTMSSIIKMARENSLYVLSDEIYSKYAYSRTYKSVASYGYEKAIAVQSFSKSHAMTGFRIGYAVAEEGIVKKMSALQALCITSVPEPIQYAAMNVLDHDVLPNVKTIQERLGVLCKEIKKSGLEFVVPDGAMYVFCRLPKGTVGTAISERLLEKGVAVAPGGAFGQYDEYIRISACTDIGQLIKGVKIIADTVNT